MSNIKYTGDHRTITIEGITFTKGKTIELTDDQFKQLKASGFGSAMLKNGELVEVAEKASKADAKNDKPEDEADEKPTAKTTTAKTTTAKAE